MSGAPRGPGLLRMAYTAGASLAQTFTQGDWELHYATRQGKEMWVSVGSDKSVRKSDQGFEH